ncbi:MAG: hypothetical protein LBP75_07745 [Planctomycetota bacterium]|nr:hypothetical protein [Planctomycetota bacterium]
MADDLVYFYGGSQSRIGPKGQVALPKRFREVLTDGARGLLILPGAARCLYIYTYQHFVEARDRAKEYAARAGNPEFFRRFMEQVGQLELDTQNRFVLSKELREWAGIDGQDILFIGMDTRIEVWSPAVRAAMTRDDEYEAQRRQQALNIFGI